ncbi:MAG: protein kinase [Actinomycetota bacterium]|nr:protein kinase [Actinomycetota bacterium]
MSADLPIGSELLGYQIVEVLGRGGMSVVYLAEDLRLKRRVALKLLSSQLMDDEALRERLLTESELAASLDHPNIVPIYEAGEADGRIFISMRYVEGRDLKALLGDGSLSPKRALAIVAQVAGALDAAHARGLVHRDVKPSNVLMAPTAGLDGSEHVYLADFGLTTRLSEQEFHAERGQLAGTIDYIAPEQIRGEQIDGRADLYSLGCLLFECLAGEPPFRQANDLELLFAHLEEDPPSLSEGRPELPQTIDPVLARALAKSPDDRYRSCGELVAAAREALSIPEPRRVPWPLVATVTVLVFVAAALLAVILTRDGGGPRAEPGADSLVRIDPRTNKVVSVTPVGRKSSAVAVGGGYVWVTSFGDGNVWRVDPRTGHALTIPVHGTPTGVAVRGETVLVANGPDGKSVVAIDARFKAGTFTAKLSGNIPPLVAAGSSGLWLADAENGTVAPADDIRGGFEKKIPIPHDERSFLSSYESFDDLAVGEGAIWVAGDAFARTVWRVDSRSGSVTPIPVPFVPKGIAVGERAVWVTSLLGDTVSRIDPTTGRSTATIHVGRGSAGVAAGNGAVWVANSIDGTVSRLDPRTGAVVATVPMRTMPTRLAVGAGGVWVVGSSR